MQEPMESKILQGDFLHQYDKLGGLVDTDKVHRYLCRQVWEYHIDNRSGLWKWQRQW